MRVRLGAPAARGEDARIAPDMRNRADAAAVAAILYAARS
jgi:hypothetical protein